jgi:eukaryotic-like serine/threonine-protein kinase
MTVFVTGLQMGAMLGAGHYGKVYLAQDPVHGQVAVKVLSRLAGEPDHEWYPRRNGLLQEAQRLSTATHRNVVQVYGCMGAPDGESICFTMKLCAGGSMQKAFDHGPMTLSDVRRIATEVTFGLQALHQRGMLHRDIKPANILLDADGVALLGDFGWVTDEIFLGYARAGGYLDHLAFEAWATGAGSVKTDIWALAMTLYRLLHGKNWYERQGTPRYEIAKGGFVDSLEWLPHIPAKWRRVIRQMMADDPAARYQNCEQLLAAFASLPVESDWECSVSDDLIAWSRQQKKRVHKVEWVRYSPRKHEWQGWTEPVGQGRKRTMSGSAGKVGRSACLNELKAYFASS